MKAEDTVMADTTTGVPIPSVLFGNLLPNWRRVNVPNKLREQAEISFKAGMEEEAKGGTNALSYLRGVEEGEKRGIREVVEWVEENVDTEHHMAFNPKGWQAFKKKRGIE